MVRHRNNGVNTAVTNKLLDFVAFSATVNTDGLRCDVIRIIEFNAFALLCFAHLYI
jgi:hypothetical protein